jgi:hypothetical protein
MMKKTSLAALAAIVLCGASAAASAKDNPCANIAEQRTQIEKALLENFGGADHQQELSRNAGDFQFLRLRNQPGTIVALDGCSLRYSVLTQKYSPPVENLSNNPPKSARTLDGRITWSVTFDEAQPAKLCIKSQHMVDVNWKGEGAVKEKIFRNANGNKKVFSGCLAS